MNPDMLPLILSGAGATVSCIAVMCVGIIGWLVKYVLASQVRRIDLLEAKTEAHANHIATAVNQTKLEEKSFVEIKSEVGTMRDRLDVLATQIATLIVTIGNKPTQRRK